MSQQPLLQPTDLIASPRQIEVRGAFEKPDWYFRKLGFRIKVRQDVVKAFVAGKHFDNVLDIGCGDGSISRPLLAADTQVTFFDISEEMLRYVAEGIPSHLKTMATLLCGDFSEAQLAPENFDLIICLGVVSYIDDLAGFFDKITKVLKPGGLLLLECSDGYHFLSRLSSAYSSLAHVFKPKTVGLRVRSRHEIFRALTQRSLHLEASYFYASTPPGLRRLLSQDVQYKLIKLIHGQPPGNRCSWFGNECIYLLRRTQ